MHNANRQYAFGTVALSCYWCNVDKDVAPLADWVRRVLVRHARALCAAGGAAVPADFAAAPDVVLRDGAAQPAA